MKSAILLINGLIRDLKSYRLIGIAGKQYILKILIRCFYFLLVRTHESVKKKRSLKHYHNENCWKTINGKNEEENSKIQLRW